MKKMYDSSKDTREHIIAVGDYIDIIIEEIRKYKKAELTDNINKMTTVDILMFLLYGEDIPLKNKLLRSIYHNSIHYKYKQDNLSRECLCKKYMNELCDRKINHDKTKLEYPEKQFFDKAIPLKDLTYGSDEYKKSLYDLRIALEHHYRYNRHHPEHFGNGVYGMSIMDINEMICDWTASAKRQDNGNVFDGIEQNKERYNYDNKLVKVLSNTAERYFIENK